MKPVHLTGTQWAVKSRLAGLKTITVSAPGVLLEEWTVEELEANPPPPLHPTTPTHPPVHPTHPPTQRPPNARPTTLFKNQVMDLVMQYWAGEGGGRPLLLFPFLIVNIWHCGMWPQRFHIF